MKANVQMQRLSDGSPVYRAAIEIPDAEITVYIDAFDQETAELIVTLVKDCKINDIYFS